MPRLVARIPALRFALRFASQAVGPLLLAGCVNSSDSHLALFGPSTVPAPGPAWPVLPAGTEGWSPETTAGNAIIANENRQPGTGDWVLANPALDHEVEGYASATSVGRGGSLQIFVSSRDPRYRIEIFRLGWYGGVGGRRIGDPVERAGFVQTAPEPDPVTGTIECAWQDSYLLDLSSSTESDWASGVYLAKLTALPSGKDAYVIFVVRDDGRPSTFLFQASVATYQAYNNWGGRSAYMSNSEHGWFSRKVSFNRPYAEGHGAGEFFRYEVDMLRFLEREGYDVTYATDVDLHQQQDPAIWKAHRAVLIVGHDEYCSWEQRRSLMQARSSGLGLGFFGANDMFWQVRYEPSPLTGDLDRTMVTYKEMAVEEDPDYRVASLEHLTTMRWRDLHLPEDEVIGVMYNFEWPVDESFVVADASNWVLAGTGLADGDAIPHLVGPEVDALNAYGLRPAGLEQLGHTVVQGVQKHPAFSDTTVYTSTDSGAVVFAAGTLRWSWGLDVFPEQSDLGPRPLGSDASGPVVEVSAAVQQMTRNVLSRLIGAN
jgi:hypothetical protein